MHEVILTKRVTFCASHRLFSLEMSEKENFECFGKCARENGHGHNYVLEVSLKGSVDPKTGILMNFDALKQTIEDAVLEKFDHRNLNLDLKEFQNLNPSAENICVVIWSLLEKVLPPKQLHQLLLRETESNSVIYRGE